MALWEVWGVKSTYIYISFISYKCYISITSGIFLNSLDKPIASTKKTFPWPHTWSNCRLSFEELRGFDRLDPPDCYTVLWSVVSVRGSPGLSVSSSLHSAQETGDIHQHETHMKLHTLFTQRGVGGRLDHKHFSGWHLGIPSIPVNVSSFMNRIDWHTFHR